MNDESYDVRIWEIMKRKGRKPTVRWVVGGVLPPFRRTFSTVPLADGFRSKLMVATNRGEPFSLTDGLPLSWEREAPGPPEPTPEAPTWYRHALKYCDMKWPHAAANSRSGIAEALAVVTAALIHEDQSDAPEPQTLRDALYGWAFNPPKRAQEPTPEIAHAIDWIEDASVSLADVAKPAVIRQALDAVALTMEGKKAATSTFSRKRAILYNALEYAVELELLDANPVDKVKRARPTYQEAVDRRVVASPSQVRRILAEVKKSRPALVAFFGCLYFAALRPAEAVRLRPENCHLPKRGWGYLELTGSSPRAGSAWTDSGNTHDDRSLKHRSEKEVRTVPIPPELVALLRWHLDTFERSKDGRVFRSVRGGPLSESLYGHVWSEARAVALSEAVAATPLAERPYDLRHGGVSLWLNAGVGAPEVAERAGHSVNVLLRVYAKCIDGQAHVANQRIQDALERMVDPEPVEPTDAEGEAEPGESDEPG
ncbi:site-specific integrase [Catenulispora yoronensis]|uniref:Site-specific integrase n=1 Tax=Catenulispora yoronensis TaxID=450799 RepID=A0ABP5G0L0_9ACTN